MFKVTKASDESSELLFKYVDPPRNNIGGARTIRSSLPVVQQRVFDLRLLSPNAYFRSNEYDRTDHKGASDKRGWFQVAIVKLF